MSKKRKRLGSYVTIIPFMIIVILFELIPLGGLIVRSFHDPFDAHITLTNYTSIVSKTVYQIAIKNSLKISFISSFIGLLIAFLTGLAITNSSKKIQNFFMSILNMTSNFVGLPLAFAYMVLLGSSGVLVLLGKAYGLGFLSHFNLYSINGLMILYIYFQIPLGTLLILPAFEGIKQEWKEAALMMKAGPVLFWTKIGIPVIMPSLIGTFSMLFANALAAYATAYLLVVTNVPMLPIKIADMFSGDVNQRPELGSALSVTMMLIMLIVIALCNRLKKLFMKGER
jgi:putative spermidine/putrescine transport system permease protein